MTRKKRLKLRRKWVFVLGVISTILIMNITNTMIENYKDYLHRCDIERGYTCNIFGR